jgi:DDE_Tnp_1-associated
MRGFISIFEDIEDPRAGNARHDLLELLFIALAAVLCGAEGCADMADFGAAKEDVLREVLRLEHGIPSHDTFSRVFRLLDPDAFETAFASFMGAFAKSNRLKGVVAIDGKAIKVSMGTEVSAIVGFQNSLVGWFEFGR